MSSNANCTRCRKPKRNCNCIPGTLYAPGGVSDKNWDHNAACNEPYDGLKGSAQARKKFACASCSRMIEESPCMFCRKWWVGYVVEGVNGRFWEVDWGWIAWLVAWFGVLVLWKSFRWVIGLILNGLDSNCFGPDVQRAMGARGVFGHFKGSVYHTVDLWELLRIPWCVASWKNGLDWIDLSFQFSCLSWPSLWHCHAKLIRPLNISNQHRKV